MSLWVELIVHKADWAKHGKAAASSIIFWFLIGPDMLIAIWDGVSPGTRDSILKAVTKGIPLIVEVIR